MSKNITYKKKNPSLKLQADLLNFTDRMKNYNRLEAIVVSSCGERCLVNFKDDNLDTNERICMTNCAMKFYDVLDLGENIYSKFNEKSFDVTKLLKGDFLIVANQI